MYTGSEVKTPLIFTIPWAPTPFPKKGLRALTLPTGLSGPYEFLFGIVGFFAGIQQIQWGDGGVGLGNEVPIAAFCVPFW